MRIVWFRSLASLAILTSSPLALASRTLDLSGRTTLQSSILHGGSPGRAIDANDQSSWSSGTCTHTAAERFPFWSVQLTDPQQGNPSVRVETIAIKNRSGHCDNRLVHPNHVHMCNPGQFLGQSWSCDANPNLSANGQHSCSSGWRSCVAGCNPGIFQHQHWRCPNNPQIPTGQSCPTGWERCDPSKCSERLDGIEVWVGRFIEDTSITPLPRPPGAAVEFVGQSNAIRDALRQNDGLTKCNGGRPVYVGANDPDVIEVDCGGAEGRFLYIAKNTGVGPYPSNSILSLCNVAVTIQ